MTKKHSSQRIYIIGAGVSGLVTAINLEDKGYQPVILEKSNEIGGRVKTELVDGYQLDMGFQVLLDAYPMAQKYLDYRSLELQKLLPGAMLFSGGNRHGFGDPLRHAGFFLSTILSKAGTVSDKWKIFQLRKELGRKKLQEIFEDKEVSTLEYLKKRGFSEKMISNFFRPFFAGIFLESELSTSSRMFEFVYKMFAEGNAVIPKGGIGAITQQLGQQLKKTEIRKNVAVEKVENRRVFLASGEILDADFIIIATEPSKLLPNYESSLRWKSCKNLYFTSSSRVLKEPIIGLNTTSGRLVNNIFYPTSVMSDSKGRNELLSITVINDQELSDANLRDEVEKELTEDFGISNLSFLKQYNIPFALPQLGDLQYQNEVTESKIMDHVALAGDYLVNGSLNAAMISGEQAAETADRVLSDNYLTLG